MAVDSKYKLYPAGYINTETGAGPYVADDAGNMTLIGTGGGGGGNGGTPDTAQAVKTNDGDSLRVHPELTGSENAEFVLEAGVPLQLPDFPCKQVSFVNVTNHDGKIIQGGKGFRLLGRAYFSVFGLQNANQLTLSIPEGGEVDVRYEW